MHCMTTPCLRVLRTGVPGEALPFSVDFFFSKKKAQAHTMAQALKMGRVIALDTQRVWLGKSEVSFAVVFVFLHTKNRVFFSGLRVARAARRRHPARTGVM